MHCIYVLTLHATKGKKKIIYFRSEYGAFWKCVTAGAIYMITQLAKMIFLATVFPVPLDEDDDDPNAEIPFDFLMVSISFIPYFRLLVFGILVTSVARFCFRFFSLAHLALQNVKKVYIIFSYFHNCVAKSDQNQKREMG